MSRRVAASGVTSRPAADPLLGREIWLHPRRGGSRPPPRRALARSPARRRRRPPGRTRGEPGGRRCSARNRSSAARSRRASAPRRRRRAACPGRRARAMASVRPTDVPGISSTTTYVNLLGVEPGHGPPTPPVWRARGRRRQPAIAGRNGLRLLEDQGPSDAGSKSLAAPRSIRPCWRHRSARGGASCRWGR